VRGRGFRQTLQRQQLLSHHRQVRPGQQPPRIAQGPLGVAHDELHDQPRVRLAARDEPQV